MLLRKLSIKNFRGLQSLDLDLDQSTVLIGENNTGKTSVLHALRYCLDRVRSKKNFVFDEYDFHFSDEKKDPSTAPDVTILLEFNESKPDEWSEDLVQTVGDFAVLDDKDCQHVRLQVRCWFDKNLKDFQQDWSFLDPKGNVLPKAANPSVLSSLQQIRPLYYLSALREAGREFSRGSEFWGPFLRNSDLDPAVKNEIEEALNELNAKVVDAHESFEMVKDHLSKLQHLISLGNGENVSIEAVPGRVFDMLSRAQVTISSSTGVKLPIVKHGEGTQSLSVLLLFDAFLKARLTKIFNKVASPIIALEEPEAHLHPCAIRALWNTIDSLNGQKLISTHSGDLLSEVPVSSIRRLYRSKNEIKVGFLKPSTLNPEEIRRLNYQVRRSRGELFFANTWLLSEGESDYCILKECARILKMDIERWGVRCIEYRNSDIEFFVKVANDLGINWFCFLDGDQQGNTDKAKVKKWLGNRAEKDHVLQISEDSMEHLLCGSGYGEVYEGYLSAQNKVGVTVAKDHKDYWKQVLVAIKKSYQKPVAALEVVEKIQGKGAKGVPASVKQALEAAVALGKGNQ